VAQPRAARQRVALTELTEIVATPTLDRAVVQERAGMAGAGGDGDGPRRRAQVDRQERVAHTGIVRRARTAVRDAALTELTLEAVAPTLHRAVVEQRAAVPLTRGDRDRRAPCAEVDRRQ